MARFSRRVPVNIELQGTLTLQRAKAYAAANLGDPDLNPSRVAAAVGVSLRRLQELFRDDGGNLAAWIWQLRLEKAAQRLSDPAYLHLQVGEARRRPVDRQACLRENETYAKRDQDRGDHEAGDDELEQKGRPFEPLAESQAAHDRHHDRRDHDHQTQDERAAETAPDVADCLLLKEVVEPVKRHAPHREGEATFRSLKAQDRDGDGGTVKEKQEQPKDRGQR